MRASVQTAGGLRGPSHLQVQEDEPLMLNVEVTGGEIRNARDNSCGTAVCDSGDENEGKTETSDRDRVLKKNEGLNSVSMG